MSFYDAIRVGASGAADFEVKRSLRFNSGDSTYLQNTPSSAGNRKTNTLSFWVKLGKSGISDSGTVASCNSSNSNANNISVVIRTGSVRIVGYYNNFRITNRILRDPSAWYHIVVAIDTTQGSADNRIKLYVNGVQETSFSTSGSVGQNDDLGFAQAATTRIGSRSNDGNGSYFDGYLAEVNFIDGQALTPTSFAETDTITGQWNPIDTSDLTFGTTGFYVKFADNSGTTATTLGKDSSGNGNNFTPNNFSVSAGIDGDSFADTPTNNFCTLNPLVRSTNAAQSLSDGNLTRSGSSHKCVGTFVLKNNKYYFEVKVEDGNGNAGIGVTQADTDFRTRDNTEAAAYFTNGEYKIEGSGQISGFSTYGNGDIIGVAIDTTLSTPKVWFSKNNTWQGTGDPSTTGYSLTAGKDYVFNVDHGSNSSTTTATAFFGAHMGEFNYTPPTGFVAASSANLPDPTILLPNKHFDTDLYTGTGSSLSRSAFNFQPDWLWFKSRSASGHNHALFDSVRGRAVGLSSDQTYSEFTSSASNDLVSFDNDGFTLGGNQNFASVNGSGTKVAWAWNGGDTDGKTYTVTVVSDSGNKYRFDGFGTSAVTLDLAEGGTYIFDQSDSSNAGHPLRFSTTSNGTHGGGSEYTTGVTTAGTPGQSGAYTQIIVAASAPTLYYYCTNHSGMGGQANTNSTLGSSNFDGAIQSTAKVNATAGFSIVSYTGNGTNSTDIGIGHSLGVSPQVVIVKNRDGSNRWQTWHHKLSSDGTYTTKNILLNSSNAESGYSSQIKQVSSTTFTVRDVDSNGNANVNKSGDDYIAYVFSEVAGYSKFGSYTGNGSSDGPFIFLGFRPALFIQKRTDTSGNWYIFDNKRSGFNVDNDMLVPNLADAEYDGQTYPRLDFVSNGIKWRDAGSSVHNASGGSYIYLAFAESPFKYARAR